jgi:hypothetical protein
MIGSVYIIFTRKYSALFANDFGLVLHFYTKYKDPPFNTIQKEDYKHKSSNDFFEKYCPD